VMFHLNASRALALLDRDADALAEADKAVDCANDESRLITRLNRVRMLQHAEKYDKAVAECEALLKEANQPGAVRDIRYTLANVYSLRRDHARAESNCNGSSRTIRTTRPRTMTLATSGRTRVRTCRKPSASSAKRSSSTRS